MFFTSQRLMVGQQATSSACSRTFSRSAKLNAWQGTTDSCCVPVGTRTQGTARSGFRTSWNTCGSKPGLETLAKNFLTMKNSLKSTGNQAANQGLVSTYSTMTGIEAQAGDQSFTAEKIFHKKPNTRVPESPEEENFRNLIKSNLPRPKASQALLQRIRSISQESQD